MQKVPKETVDPEIEIKGRAVSFIKGVVFEKVEMHCNGGPFDKCTLRLEISVNLGKTKSFCQKSLNILLWKNGKFEENAL